MRIAIVSDFHLGYERFAEDAYNQALAALSDAAEKADMLLIPGDIFDNRSPKPEVLAHGINIFRSLSYRQWPARIVEYEGKDKIYTEKPIIAIPGTHERRAVNGDDAVKLLSLAGLLADAHEARVIAEKGGEKVAIYGIGGIAEELFRKTLNELSPKPVAGAFNIFFFHQSVYELLPFSDDFIHLEELPEGFDLYVDGHIHNRIERRVHGKPFLIPGSTVLTQLKDAEQEEKGYFVFDTKSKDYSFNKIKSRRFVVKEIDVSGMGAEEVSNRIEEAVKSIAVGGDKPVIRIILSGKLKNGLKHGDIEIQQIAKRLSSIAIVEINRSHLGEDVISSEQMKREVLGNMPIKDYGTGIFVEKLKEKKYALSISPTQLFDLLSSEKKKEKAIKEALEALLNSNKASSAGSNS